MNRRQCFATLVFAASCFAVAHHAHAQQEAEPYSRLNTFSIFGEYSNDSSHIILGATPDRKLAGIGVEYERRLIGRQHLELAYAAEFRPFIVSSDPLETFVSTSALPGEPPSTLSASDEVFKCTSGTNNYVFAEPGPPPYSIETVVVTSCSRQNTLAQGGSPAGLRLTLFPRRRTQLFFSSNGGYMYSTKPIPVPGAGSFNFTFNFGGGVERFLSPHRSVRLEYLVQHYSNHDTADENPGVDSGFVRVSYAFGR